MNCPACTAPAPTVVKTIDAHISTIRECRCRSCSARWVTEETVKVGSVSLAINYPPMAIPGQPPAGGVGGGLPSVSGSGLFPDLDLIHRSKGSEVVRKTRARRAVQDYTPEFEAFWLHTGKCCGNKLPAFMAYVNSNERRPPEADLFAAWDRYMASAGPVSGHVQHLATWLNGRGWETEWRPPPIARPGANGAHQRTDAERRATALPPPPPGWKSTP